MLCVVQWWDVFFVHFSLKNACLLNYLFVRSIKSQLIPVRGSYKILSEQCSLGKNSKDLGRDGFAEKRIFADFFLRPIKISR